MTLRCLIVDDSPEVRFLLSCAMEADGRFTVVGEAATARDALEQARRLRPDAVLVDLGLEGEDGTWLLRRLRQETVGSRLIAVTGSADPSDHARATECGADAVFVKRDLTTTLLDQIHQATR